jgi:hypothetical protein
MQTQLSLDRVIAQSLDRACQASSIFRVHALHAVLGLPPTEANHVLVSRCLANNGGRIATCIEKYLKSLRLYGTNVPGIGERINEEILRMFMTADRLKVARAPPPPPPRSAQCNFNMLRA